ncbi:MAG: TraX family protein [Leptolyngbyaceae bacterium]|nr:TraX family protein [Leptolyngbyaceae bacterium]
MGIPLQLNNYHIKLLAAFWMIVDHVGVIFFPQILTFRVLGRLSFPLFAWLLAQGEKHTHNFQNYLLRLLVLGAISQIPYFLALTNQNLNILFTLALGLWLLRLSRLAPPPTEYIILGIGAIAAEVLNFSYGAYGILMIGLIAKFKPTLLWWAVWIVLHLVSAGLLSSSWGLFQFPAVITPVFLHFANHQQGKTARWFYGFYPLHLLILLGIKRFYQS